MQQLHRQQLFLRSKSATYVNNVGFVRGFILRLCPSLCCAQPARLVRTKFSELAAE